LWKCSTTRSTSYSISGIRQTWAPPASAEVRRDPSGVAAHDLDDHDALVALGGGVQPLERLGHHLDRGGEADRHLGGLEVVVDRLGHADDLGRAALDELLAERHRAVAADHDQPAQIEPREVGHAGGADVVDLGAAVGQLERVRERVGAVRRAEDGAAAGQELLGPGRIEIDVLLLVQALEAVADADHFPAVGVAGVEHHRADHRVEARAVAAAGEDADALAHRRQYALAGPLTAARGSGKCPPDAAPDGPARRPTLRSTATA
jgi:hypothetical protein